MAETLTVQVRKESGKRHNKRLRIDGSIPAVLYGHGAESVSLAVPTEQISAAVRHGSRLVELAGGVSEKALIGDLQWDVFGGHVLHVDFVRVSEGERVTISVSLDLRGEAPGMKEGGSVELVLHELEIECPVTAIPDRIHVSVKQLHVDQHLTAGEIELPPEAKLVTDPDIVVVTCSAVIEEGDEGAPAATVEPELIGRKSEGEEGDES